MILRDSICGVGLDGLRPWTVRAVNLPEHGRNAIHTDAGARAAGFPAALVAGVTTYAYLTHPPADAWGVGGVASGGGEVRFRSPVFDGDEVSCEPVADDDGMRVDALVAGVAKATFRVWRHGGPLPVERPGEELPTRRVQLAGEWGGDYGRRAGDDLDLYERLGIVHPAVWPSLANNVVHTSLARGSWIHIRSRIAHHATAPTGAWADVHSVVVARSQRRTGERAVLDVRIEVAGLTVATLEHEAIIALP